MKYRNGQMRAPTIESYLPPRWNSTPALIQNPTHATFVLIKFVIYCTKFPSITTLLNSRLLRIMRLYDTLQYLCWWTATIFVFPYHCTQSESIGFRCCVETGYTNWIVGLMDRRWILICSGVLQSFCAVVRCMVSFNLISLIINIFLPT
jgi:hypothetical protein